MFRSPIKEIIAPTLYAEALVAVAIFAGIVWIVLGIW